MKKKFLSLVLVASMTAMMLSGCGNAQEEIAPSEPAQEEAPAEPSEEPPVEEEVSDEERAQEVADLIDAIYVQEWTEETDELCAQAKAAWDALTDARKRYR